MINKATLLGTIQKIQSKIDKDGKTVCMLSVTTIKQFLDSHQNSQEIVTWHNVHFFNHLATRALSSNEKDLIFLEGEISNKKVDDKTVHYIKGTSMKIINSNEDK